MGCFSYKCQVCDTPINSGIGYGPGEHCTLLLLDQGTVIQTRSGPYDSYGGVDDGAEDWSIGGDACASLDLADDKSNGIAAFHTLCYTKAKSPLPLIHINSAPLPV